MWRSTVLKSERAARGLHGLLGVRREKRWETPFLGAIYRGSIYIYINYIQWNLFIGPICRGPISRLSYPDQNGRWNTRWRFRTFSSFHPEMLGNDPIWFIFFKRVEPSNLNMVDISHETDITLICCVFLPGETKKLSVGPAWWAHNSTNNLGVF